VEPSAPASGTSLQGLQGSSRRSVPGSGCTPRGGSKVAPRAPANGDGHVIFYNALLTVLAFAVLKAGNWKYMLELLWSVIFRGLDEHS
jgi:hypothetical protein